MKGKELSNLVAHRARHRRGDSSELAAQLAPLEELSESSEAGLNASQDVAQENGAIVVGAEQSELAKEAVAAEKRKGGLEPVVIVIVGLILAFIVFIAWQISQMPAQDVIK